MRRNKWRAFLRGRLVAMDIRPENLAYWYLRLNGFLTIQNFVVHPDRGDSQGTEVDILGVRFPYRAENLERPMQDDAPFAQLRDKTWIAIAEVKSGRCGLNGPWTHPERRNMLRVLRAIGAYPEAEAEIAAKALHHTGHYQSQFYYASLMCFGRDDNLDIAKRYSRVPQILWPKILRFIYGRFREYTREKSSHPQWDETGHALWLAFEKSHDDGEFLSTVRVI